MHYFVVNAYLLYCLKTFLNNPKTTLRPNGVVFCSVFGTVIVAVFSCPATAVNQLCGPSRPTASVSVRSRVPVLSVAVVALLLISWSSGRRVCLWQYTSFNIAWTNHWSVVVWSFMSRAGRDKYSEKMVFPPKEWQASSLWLSLCLTWWFIRAVKGYMAYYGPLWPLCSLLHGAHATVFSFNVSPMSARKTSSFRGVPGHFQNHYLISAALPHKGTTGLENRRNIRIHK